MLNHSESPKFMYTNFTFAADVYNRTHMVHGKTKMFTFYKIIDKNMNING